VQAIILLSEPCFLCLAGLKFCGLTSLANAGTLGIELGGTALKFGFSLRVNDLPAAFPGHDLTELARTALALPCHPILAERRTLRDTASRLCDAWE